MQESEAMYIKALNVDVRCNQAWCNLGVLQALRRDFDSAERSYGKAMYVDPTHETTLYNFGILKADLKQIPAAEQLLHR
jgi:Flp pilus assembly protein TadD